MNSWLRRSPTMGKSYDLTASLNPLLSILPFSRLRTQKPKRNRISWQIEDHRNSISQSGAAQVHFEQSHPVPRKNIQRTSEI